MNGDSNTLRYYDAHAKAFIENTLHADMSESLKRFLHFVPAGGHILDLGCGSGRDSRYFLDLGYQVTASDGSEELCRQTSAYLGIPVKHMLFQDLDDRDEYDGVWACASILHLPKTELEDVVKRIGAALKDRGIFYTSFKYGEFEGMRGGRYFTDFTEGSLCAFLGRFPDFELIECWITQDVRPGRGEESWINLLARHRDSDGQKNDAE